MPTESTPLRRFISLGTSLVVALTCSAKATAQLTPRHTYYGVERTMGFDVEAPDGAFGEVEIALYVEGEDDPIESVPAAAGGVDLHTLFPRLSRADDAKVYAAQLLIGDAPFGPAVILLPMLDQDRAARAMPDGTMLFESDVRRQRAAANGRPAPEPSIVLSGYVAYVDRHVILDTSEGQIELRMRPDAAPNTVRHFLDLVEGGMYRDIIFHRIINRLPNGERFVVQVGDPTGTGRGGPGRTVDLERSSLKHDYGVVSMARSSHPDSAGSQLFICLSRNGTKSLDGGYTAFAEVVSGQTALEAIATTPVDRSDRPLAPPVLELARTIPAPPKGIAGPSRIIAPPPPKVER